MGHTSPRILITGGAGFIGSEMAHQAVSQGFRVEVVDNLVNGRRENLADLDADACRLHVVDVRDTDAVREIMRGCDAVYHLACLCLRHSIHEPRENHDVNASGTMSMVLAARDAQVPCFVYTSTAEVYGSACRGRVTEENELAPTNPYGAAKLGAESYVRAFNVSYGLPAVVLRLFNTYGPRCHHEGDCGEVIPKFLLRALAGQPLVVFGDGTQTRDFNFVADTARAILSAGFRPEAIGKVLNIGSGRDTSINELAEVVRDVVGKPRLEIVHDAPRPADIARMCADGTRAREVLGYTPEIPLADGLVRLKDWYLKGTASVEGLLSEECVHNWDREALTETASRKAAVAGHSS